MYIIHGRNVTFVQKYLHQIVHSTDIRNMNTKEGLIKKNYAQFGGNFFYMKDIVFHVQNIIKSMGGLLNHNNKKHF